MKHIYSLTLLFSYFLFSIVGCGKKESIVTKPSEKVTAPPPITIEKKVEPKYVYKGELYRDPFLPLTEKKIISPTLETSGEGEMPVLGALVLTGIIKDKIHNIALLSSPKGSYILKDGKLYDSRNRVVKDIKGNIVDKTVTLVTKDKFIKTYKMHKTE